jgi:hypothetical protein
VRPQDQVRIEPGIEAGPRRIIGGIYRQPNGAIDIFCIKNLDKDFIYMTILIGLMTIGIVIYACV